MYLYWIPFVGFLLFGWGIWKQIQKTWYRRSVEDIAITEVFLRTTASSLTMFGMVLTHNPWLIIGNAVNLILMISYLSLVLKIHFHSRTQP